VRGFEIIDFGRPLPLVDAALGEDGKPIKAVRGLFFTSDRSMIDFRTERPEAA